MVRDFQVATVDSLFFPKRRPVVQFGHLPPSVEGDRLVGDSNEVEVVLDLLDVMWFNSGVATRDEVANPRFELALGDDLLLANHEGHAFESPVVPLFWCPQLGSCFPARVELGVAIGDRFKTGGRAFIVKAADDPWFVGVEYRCYPWMDGGGDRVRAVLGEPAALAPWR